MKATTYEPGERVVGDDHCDRQTTVTSVTVLSNRVKSPSKLITRRVDHYDSRKSRQTVTVVPDNEGVVTHRKSRAVTVLLPITEFYLQRLRMSRYKIKAVWLTVERVAELLGCSTRTVWRYVKRHQVLVYKHQVTQGRVKVVKAFLLTEPEVFVKEMADCESRGMLPAEFLEVGIEVDGVKLNSALIYKYRNINSQDGSYYEAL